VRPIRSATLETDGLRYKGNGDLPDVMLPAFADEKLAAKFPITDDPAFDYRCGNLRRRDGTVTKP
jgi:hypothetical protein